MGCTETSFVYFTGLHKSLQLLVPSRIYIIYIYIYVLLSRFVDYFVYEFLINDMLLFIYLTEFT